MKKSAKKAPKKVDRTVKRLQQIRSMREALDKVRAGSFDQKTVFEANVTMLDLLEDVVHQLGAR